MIRPIAISLSPNTEQDDIRLALQVLFQPWNWKNGSAVENLEQEFAEYLGVQHAVSFNSGRSSLLAIFNALGFKEGDEILLQAFTCNAVPNPVLWKGLKPVYVDCREDDYNMDAADLERKITKKSRAVIVQHTFGIPADVERIQDVCKKHNLILVEDCAHALGAKVKGRPVGSFGNVSFFSFSRDKVISSVYGGMAATNDNALADKLRRFQKKAGSPSLLWTLQQLLHVPLMNLVVLPTYGVGGKYLLVFLQWFKVLSKAVHWKEKRGKRPGYFPKSLPNALAVLALHQFCKLERLNAHRKEVAAFYRNTVKNVELPGEIVGRESIYLRMPVRHLKAHAILKKAWARNLLLGDWYTTPVAPHDTQLEKVGYVKGSCPTAEKLSQTTFNLPTHIRITEKEANKVVQFLKSFET